MPQGNPLGFAPINQLLRKFCIPTVIMMVVGSLYNMVDQIFIGQGIGLLGNAATNVAFPITTVVLAISVMLGIGGSANFNLLSGQKKEEEAKMLHRVESLKESLAAKQKVHLTLITTYGLVQGKHSGKVQKVVTCDDLFVK